MKRNKFFIIFFSAQLVFIFLQIHRHTRFINHSFAKQRNEKNKNELTQKIQELSHQLSLTQEHSAIKEFAQTQLGMQPINIDQIKKLPYKDETHDNRSI